VFLVGLQRARVNLMDVAMLLALGVLEFLPMYFFGDPKFFICYFALSVFGILGFCYSYYRTEDNQYKDKNLFRDIKKDRLVNIIFTTSLSCVLLLLIRVPDILPRPELWALGYINFYSLVTLINEHLFLERVLVKKVTCL
jgi:hypothetical protein